MNRIVLPLIIAVSFYRVWKAGLVDLALVFGVSIGVLCFFSLLIRFRLSDKNSSNSELMARTVTFWWMLAFFQISVASSAIVFSCLLTLFCLTAFYEYIRFDNSPRPTRSIAVNSGCALLIPIAFMLAYQGRESHTVFICLVFLMLALPTLLVMENATDGQLKRFGHLSSGMIFFAVALSFAVSLYQLSIMVLLLCVFLTEVRDMSAYWIGKFAQKQQLIRPSSSFLQCLNRPVADQINKSKSWGVGLLSIFMTVILALSFSGLINRSLDNEVTLLHIALWGLILGFLGLMGDLVFSMLKREFSIKDSGSIMPGNTGIIDRIDALILTIPATYLLFANLA